MSSLLKLRASFTVSVIAAVLSFVAGIIIARELGAQDRGTFAVLLSFQQLMVVAISFGLSDSSLLYGVEEDNSREGLLSLYLILSLVFGLISLGTMAYYFNVFIDLGTSNFVFLLVWLGVPITIYLGLLINLTLVFNNEKLFNSVRLLRGLIYFLVVILLAYLEVPLEIKYLFIALLISVIVGIAYLLYEHVVPEYHKSWKMSLSLLIVHLHGLKKIHGYSFFVTLGWAIVGAGPIIFLNEYVSRSDVGHFSVAYNLGQAFVSLMLPTFALMVSKVNISFKLKNMAAIMLLLVGTGLIISNLFAEHFVIMVYGDEYLKASEYLILISPYFGCLVVAHAYNSQLKAAGEIKKAAIAMCISVSLAVIVFAISIGSGIPPVAAMGIALTLFAFSNFVICGYLYPIY